MTSEIRRRARDVTPSFYFQLVGMVQSLAAGYLIVSVPASPALWPIDGNSVLYWLLIIADFNLIVLTWHITVQDASTLYRLSGLSDSYITFFFLIPEYFLIQYATEGKLAQWLISFAVYCAVTLIAYVDMFVFTKRERDNLQAFRAIGHYPALITCYICLGGSF